MRGNWHGRYPRVLPDVVGQMVALYHEGKTTREIASEVGVGSGTVSKVLRRAGVPKRKSFKRKKLSLEQRRDLAEGYTKGETFEALQKVYGVSNSIVESCLDEFGVKSRTGWGRFKTEEWMDANGRVWIFKSTWELAYAQWLDGQNYEWDYEPCKFGLRKCSCYTPDFVVRIDGAVEYHEVKGWLDDRTMDRLREFVEMHSGKSLKIIGPMDMVHLGLVGEEYIDHPMAEKVSLFQREVQTGALGRLSLVRGIR